MLRYDGVEYEFVSSKIFDLASLKSEINKLSDALSSDEARDLLTNGGFTIVEADTILRHAVGLCLDITGSVDHDILINRLIRSLAELSRLRILSDDTDVPSEQIGKIGRNVKSVAEESRPLGARGY